jgi:hypothetical protein
LTGAALPIAPVALATNARRSSNQARDSLGQIARDPAHAATIADEPADGPVELGDRLDHAHERERRQLRPAKGLRQPQAKEPGIGTRLKQGIRQPALPVDALPMLRHERRQPPDLREDVAEARMTEAHSVLSHPARCSSLQ